MPEPEERTPERDSAVWELPSNHERIAVEIELFGKRVVDVGCGAGSLVRFLRSQGADAVGVECGAAMISQARQADPDHGECYLEGVGQDLPLADESADVAIFSYSLHHIPVADMADALREAARVVRPGGSVVVLEPIAEGPGFETHKLVDDETEVRRIAQDALDDRPSALVETRSPIRYETGYSYTDFAALKQTMVDIDPTRQAAFADVAAETEQRFFANALVGPGGFWFRQPVLMRVFERTPSVADPKLGGITLLV